MIEVRKVKDKQFPIEVVLSSEKHKLTLKAAIELESKLTKILDDD